MSSVTFTNANNTQYTIDTTNTKSKEEIQEINDDVSARNSWKRELGEVSFEIKYYENLDPKEISFKDYQGLNIDALNTMFGKGSPRWEEAVNLINRTSFTEDDTLNEVLFENELESIKNNEISNGTLMFFAMADLYLPDFHVEAKNFNPENFMENMKKGIMPEVTNRKETIPIISTKDQLFADFERYKELHSAKVDINTIGSFTYEDIFNTMDDIKSRYYEKISEQKSLLEQLTKNNKQTPTFS